MFIFIRFFYEKKLFNWNRRATVGIVLDDAATDVAVVVAGAMIVVFALLADGDRVPVDDGFAVFVVDIFVCPLYFVIIQAIYLNFLRAHTRI